MIQMFESGPHWHTTMPYVVATVSEERIGKLAIACFRDFDDAKAYADWRAEVQAGLISHVCSSTTGVLLYRTRVAPTPAPDGRNAAR